MTTSQSLRFTLSSLEPHAPGPLCRRVCSALPRFASGPRPRASPGRPAASGAAFHPTKPCGLCSSRGHGYPPAGAWATHVPAGAPRQRALPQVGEASGALRLELLVHQPLEEVPEPRNSQAVLSPMTLAARFTPHDRVGHCHWRGENLHSRTAPIQSGGDVLLLTPRSSSTPTAPHRVGCAEIARAPDSARRRRARASIRLGAAAHSVGSPTCNFPSIPW